MVILIVRTVWSNVTHDNWKSRQVTNYFDDGVIEQRTFALTAQFYLSPLNSRNRRTIIYFVFLYRCLFPLVLLRTVIVYSAVILLAFCTLTITRISNWSSSYPPCIDPTERRPSLLRQIQFLLLIWHPLRHSIYPEPPESWLMAIRLADTITVDLDLLKPGAMLPLSCKYIC